MNYIKGNYKKSIFSGENGYKVGLFKVKEGSGEYNELSGLTVTFTGYFHELNENDTYIFYGDFVLHNKYGEQFSVSNYERVMPEEKDSMVEFLCSGLFKGIGKKKAEKIVSVLGDETFKIILNNKDNLLLIPGITKKNIEVLHDTLLEYESSYNTILTLNDLGFNTRDSMLIYNKFKQKTESIIDNNIYDVYYQVNDISFKTVDRIAISNGYSKSDMRRISACILYVFIESTNTIGDCYYSIDYIYKYSIKVIDTDIADEEFIDGLNYLILNLKVVKEDENYYLKEIYEAEKNISKRFAFLSRLPDIKYKNLEVSINEIETLNRIEYDEKQILAIKQAITKNILVITGGPGSGKTTIIKTILDLYRTLNKTTYDKMINEVALLAPTGRASKRLSEASLFYATTIHRFLKWNKESDRFSINEYNKSDAKFVIVDEASMVDVYLLDSLLKGLRTDTKIILVGDYNQLPSVGPGQVLKDIIDSETIECIKLNKIHRQKIGSNIIDLAYDINNGELNEDIFDNGNDLIFKKSTNINKDISEIAKKYKNIDYKDFQVLAPMYKTLNGIDNLNKILQEIFNPDDGIKREIKIDDVIFRENDKVLQLTNMPDENVFNGDIGIIREINSKEITIDFDGLFVKYTPSNYKKFKHAYAISIHKSQGSEFKTVLLPVTNSYSKMLYRKLYYTAVTRSKNNLIILGDINALKNACRNNISADRKTTLKEKLIEKITFTNKS